MNNSSNIYEIYKRTREMCEYIVKYDASLKETVDHFREIGKYDIAVSTLYDDILDHIDSKSELRGKALATLKRHYPLKSVNGEERGKKVVYLHDVEKLSFSQVGKILNISKALAVSDYQKYKDMAEASISSASKTLLYMNKKSRELLDDDEALMNYAIDHDIDPDLLEELLSETEEDSLNQLKERENSNRHR